jgi:hypothetical protein
VVLGSSELIVPGDLPESLLEKAGSIKVTRYHDAIAEAKRRPFLLATQEAAAIRVTTPRLWACSPPTSIA